MSDQAALLGLLQIADSAFPAGGFAHSAGLEQMVRDACIADAGGVERYVRSLIRHSIATGDAAAAALAAQAMVGADPSAIIRIDHALYAMKATSELRNASTSMGHRLLQEVSMHVEDPVLEELLARVRDGHAPCTYAVAFGAIGGALGATPQPVAAALMHSTASSILQASLRLLPVSHRDMQRTLHALRPVITESAAEAASMRIDDLRSFHPQQEVASMRHRAATVRLFAS